MPTLEAIDLCKSYPTPTEPLHVLRNCSISLDAGQNAAILGPSGSGKSTLLHILGTLDRPTSGRFQIGGVDPLTLSEPALADFRNQRIGFVFQDHHLLPQCSVLENVLVPTLARPTNETIVTRAGELLDRVGLAGRTNHLPSELSGGERQRAAVARALIHRPAVILADEPTGNLDRKSAAAIADLLLELPRTEQAVLVVVTHSAGLAERFERRLEMNDGRLVPLA